MFSKYYRVEGAHQRTGSGPGLYPVKCLVEREGGYINHYTEARVGAPALIYFEFR
ncbi:hypothetical protein PSQ39_01260 [Curvibacter sp. HBC28]|uniref:Uncharacterized protein n=1 Tax=Curvibacter microcysteis TaxID=3026419 RepID=A0ABT5M9I9_9BURK|nr:hypothetical protein [Curvibacter sp. HBC28]MDD0813249.1 hypothetical protein [Curvibacter sp. HBC28]